MHGSGGRLGHSGSGTVFHLSQCSVGFGLALSLVSHLIGSASSSLSAM